MSRPPNDAWVPPELAPLRKAYKTALKRSGDIRAGDQAALMRRAVVLGNQYIHALLVDEARRLQESFARFTRTSAFDLEQIRSAAERLGA